MYISPLNTYPTTTAHFLRFNVRPVHTTFTHFLPPQVTALQSRHVDDDVRVAATVTRPESALGAHYALVLRSWRDKLPYARALLQPTIKQRHIAMLMGWIKVWRV